MITKKCNNSLLFDYLAFLNKSNFKYVYKINKTSNGYSYKYIIGKTYKNAVELSYLKLYKIAMILKNLHTLSFRYGYIHNFKQEEIICHTDISPLNIIFNFLGWPKKIIDFDECEILHYIYDVIFLLCTCINIGDWNKINFKTKAKKVLFFISQYKDGSIGGYVPICLWLHNNDTKPKLNVCACVYMHGLWLHNNDTKPKHKYWLWFKFWSLWLHNNDTKPKLFTW